MDRIIAGFGFKLQRKNLKKEDRFDELYEVIEDSIFNQASSKYGFWSDDNNIWIGWFQNEDDFAEGIKFTAIDKIPDQETIGQVALKVLRDRYGYLLDGKTFGYYRGYAPW